MSGPLYQSVLCPVLVGRAPLVAALERLTERTGAGRGATALLAGEAGIGKSRLVTEVRGRAGRRGMTILVSHCFEPNRVLPYAPLFDLLRGLPGGQCRNHMHTLGPAAGDLAALLPELVTLGLLPEGTPPATATPPDPESSKRRIFEALVQVFVY